MVLLGDFLVAEWFRFAAALADAPSAIHSKAWSRAPLAAAACGGGRLPCPARQGIGPPMDGRRELRYPGQTARGRQWLSGPRDVADTFGRAFRTGMHRERRES